MIIEVKGDILLSKADAVAHGVAVNDDFKQGLALSIREQWPALYKDFRHYCHTSSPKEGEIWMWRGPGSAAFYQLFTQPAPKHEGDHPGKATLPNINHALKHLAHELEKSGAKSVAITKLATGVGGMPWSEVKPMIEKHLGGLKLNVYVYSTFAKGVKAEEK